MSNLKKVLSLSVVFIMVFALMASAGASFGDADEIEFVDEANLLSSLEIIKGDLSGNFLPKSEVYRNQMAKMIYVAYNKGIDNGAPLYASLDVPLKDISNDWARNYIKFVYSMGIISGSPSGYFFGSNKVTGFEAAKMMLTMLGYDSDAEGYVGAAWKNNVARDAMLAGILDGLENIDLGKNLTKEEAAKMIYNTIFTEMVKYDDGVTVGTTKTFAETKLALQTKTGILMATDVAGLTGVPAEKGKIVVKISGTDTSITGNASIEDLGKEVTVYVRMKVDGVTIDKAYGSAVATAKNKVKVVYNASGDLDDVAAAYDANIFNGIAAEVAYSSKYGTVADPTTLSVNLGDKVIFISNDDDKAVEYIIHVPYTFGKVGITSTVNGNIVNIGNVFTGLKPAEILGFDGIAKDDYVIACPITGGTTYKHVVAKATDLEGKITATNSNKTKFMIGSKWYDVSGYTGAADFATDFTTIVNKDATFYVDASGRLVGYVLSTAPVEISDGKYAYVTAAQNKVVGDDFGVGAKDPLVVVMNEEGKKVTLKVDKAYKANGSAISLTASASNDLESYAVNKFFSYSLNDKGEVTLKEVANSGSVGAYTAGSSLLKIGGVNYIISDETVIFFFDANNDGDPGTTDTPVWTIKKGKSVLPGFAASDLSGNAVYDVASNGVLNAIYLPFTNKDAASSTETVNYAVVVDNSIMVDANGDYYAAIELFDGKTTTVVNTVSAATISAVPGYNAGVGSYVTFQKTDGKISSVTVKARKNIVAAPTAGEAYAGYVKAVNGAYIDVVKNDGVLVNRFKLADKAVIATVDMKNSAFAAADSVAVDYVAGYAADTGKTVLFFNSDGEVTAVFQRVDDVYASLT